MVIHMNPRPGPSDIQLAPNHHASHPGFSGISGFVAAVSFLFGRDRAARLAVDLAGVRLGDHVLDVGCGPGVAARAAEAVGAEVIGVDPAPVMLRVARARWRSDAALDWRIGTAESLPVEDGWATVVWSLSTVHHWSDVEAGLQEARRVLAPSGRLVAVERRIRDTEAAGAASHGWTPEQADSFGELCRRHGFPDVAVGEHEGRRGSVLSVVACLPT